MKIFKYFIFAVVLVLIGLTVFFYSAYSGTVAFGWKPPSTEFILTKHELIWKKKIEQKYQCNLSFVGLDINDSEDSIIYMTIQYFDSSILKEKLDDEMSPITYDISNLFKLASKKNRKQSHILIDYYNRHNFLKDTIPNNIPNHRVCLFNIDNNTVQPTFKNLLIPKFTFYDFDDDKKELFYYKLGNSLKYYFGVPIQHDTLIKYYSIKSPVNLRTLYKCESYTTKRPSIIELPNGQIQSTREFIFYDGYCVAVKINYECLPTNQDLKVKDFIERVTEISPIRLKNSKKDKLNLIKILKQNNYNINKKMFDVNVHFTVDSIKKPWTIKYETSLAVFKFFESY